MMSEIRIRLRHFLIFVIIIFVTLLYIARASHHCKLPANIYKYLRAAADPSDLPTIYAITPTYARPTQKAELTRLSHVVLLTPNIHWIIVEDASSTSSLVTNILEGVNLIERSTQLYAKTPQDFKLKEHDPNWIKPRGVEQRNAALEWIRNNEIIRSSHGDESNHNLVYFMDDDNTYSLDLFQEISRIERGKVGVWPVGLVGGLKVEKPLLNDENQVIGFNSVWRPERPFPIDMAGFAISYDLLLKHPEAMFSYEVQRGYQESEILRHLTTMDQLQPMANLCREVLVWHTRTEKPNLKEEMKLLKAGKKSDNGMEV